MYLPDLNQWVSTYVGCDYLISIRFGGILGAKKCRDDETKLKSDIFVILTKLPKPSISKLSISKLPILNKVAHF